jgi:hypothetical protein
MYTTLPKLRSSPSLYNNNDNNDDDDGDDDDDDDNNNNNNNNTFRSGDGAVKLMVAFSLPVPVRVRRTTTARQRLPHAARRRARGREWSSRAGRERVAEPRALLLSSHRRDTDFTLAGSGVAR